MSKDITSENKARQEEIDNLLKKLQPNKQIDNLQEYRKETDKILDEIINIPEASGRDKSKIIIGNKRLSEEDTKIKDNSEQQAKEIMNALEKGTNDIKTGTAKLNGVVNNPEDLKQTKAKIIIGNNRQQLENTENQNKLSPANIRKTLDKISKSSKSVIKKVEQKTNLKKNINKVIRKGTGMSIF